MTANELTMLSVAPREYRLVVERLLQYAGLDRGIVVPLRDSILDAELATGCALRYIVENADRIAACAPAAVRFGVSERAEGSIVDCAGVPALLLAPALLDRMSRHRSLTVTNTHGADQLAGLAIGATRWGICIEVQFDPDGARITRSGSAGEPFSMRERCAGGPKRLAAMTDGIVVDEQLWWTAYRRSNLALSVDTRVSRRHAGATIVEPDGTVRGATDDEIDLTVFTGDRAALFDESKER